MQRSIPAAQLQGGAHPQHGLDAAEVAERLQRFGPNRIIPQTGVSWLGTLRDALRDPMLWFLLVTSTLFLGVGQRLEAGVLLLAVLPLLGMDAWLHRRTQASVQGLSGRLAVRARVLRGGQQCEVPAEALVPGDILLLQAGEYFAADALLLECHDLQVDESMLTGESQPVRKQALDAPPLAQATAVADRHWGLAGTRVLAGSARLQVVFTGATTLYGEIVRSAIAGTHELTPLQRAVGQLVQVLVVVALLICVALAWLRYSQGYGLLDAVLSALTLAIAALPEEFPVVLTFFLGAGVYRMAQRHALVRRAVVVENIGRVSCICSDKTGTMTEGRLTLAHLQAAPQVSEALLLETAAAASRPDSGDPVDLAILERSAGLVPAALLASFPFTEERRRETAVRAHAEGLLVAVKGAPEQLLELCGLSGSERQAWLDEVAAWAGSGHKVLACARRILAPEQWSGGEPGLGLHFIGLLAFEDPLREGVRDAVQTCREAGIHVIMVTGDHPRTALAIARESGLGAGEPRLLTGDELEQHIASAGVPLKQVCDVVARATPAQKLALVRSLQAAGEIVAVTGDGVNDVPALQAADVGIAMGERGTQSAREVAAIVLLDDNFRSIAGAVAEGRLLFRNLQLSFQYLLMIHLPLVLTAALVPMLGYPMLYLPIHIVWLELIIHPTALLVFQNLRLGQPPGPPPARAGAVRFFDRWQWCAITVVGAVVTVLVLGSYVRSLGPDGDVDHARSMALLVLVMAGAGITAALSRCRGVMACSFVLLPPLLVTLMIQLPQAAPVFHVAPLHRDDLLVALGSGLLTAVLVWLGGRLRASR